MNALLLARNRLAHHEPAKVPAARDASRRIHRFATYVSQDLAQYIDETSTVEDLISKRP